MLVMPEESCSSRACIHSSQSLVHLYLLADTHKQNSNACRGLNVSSPKLESPSSVLCNVILPRPQNSTILDVHLFPLQHFYRPRQAVHLKSYLCHLHFLPFAMTLTPVLDTNAFPRSRTIHALFVLIAAVVLVLPGFSWRTQARRIKCRNTFRAIAPLQKVLVWP